MNIESGKLVVREDHKHLVCCYWEGCHDHAYNDIEMVDGITKFK